MSAFSIDNLLGKSGALSLPPPDDLEAALSPASPGHHHDTAPATGVAADAKQPPLSQSDARPASQQPDGGGHEESELHGMNTRPAQDTTRSPNPLPPLSGGTTSQLPHPGGEIGPRGEAFFHFGGGVGPPPSSLSSSFSAAVEGESSPGSAAVAPGYPLPHNANPYQHLSQQQPPLTGSTSAAMNAHRPGSQAPTQFPHPALDYHGAFPPHSYPGTNHSAPHDLLPPHPHQGFPPNPNGGQFFQNEFTAGGGGEFGNAGYPQLGQTGFMLPGQQGGKRPRSRDTMFADADNSMDGQSDVKMQKLQNNDEAPVFTELTPVEQMGGQTKPAVPMVTVMPADDGGKKKGRAAYTKEQMEGLEAAFQTNQFCTGVERTKLSQNLSLAESQICNWFQNRRGKERRRQKAASKKASAQSLPSPGSTNSNSNHGNPPMTMPGGVMSPPNMPTPPSNDSHGNLGNMNNLNAMMPGQQPGIEGMNPGFFPGSATDENSYPSRPSSQISATSDGLSHPMHQWQNDNFFGYQNQNQHFQYPGQHQFPHQMNNNQQFQGQQYQGQNMQGQNKSRHDMFGQHSMGHDQSLVGNQPAIPGMHGHHKQPNMQNQMGHFQMSDFNRQFQDHQQFRGQQQQQQQPYDQMFDKPNQHQQLLQDQQLSKQPNEQQGNRQFSGPQNDQNKQQSQHTVPQSQPQEVSEFTKQEKQLKDEQHLPKQNETQGEPKHSEQRNNMSQYHGQQESQQFQQFPGQENKANEHSKQHNEQPEKQHNPDTKDQRPLLTHPNHPNAQQLPDQGQQFFPGHQNQHQLPAQQNQFSWQQGQHLSGQQNQMQHGQQNTMSVQQQNQQQAQGQQNQHSMFGHQSNHQLLAPSNKQDGLYAGQPQQDQTVTQPQQNHPSQAKLQQGQFHNQQEGQFPNMNQPNQFNFPGFPGQQLPGQPQMHSRQGFMQQEFPNPPQQPDMHHMSDQQQKGAIKSASDNQPQQNPKPPKKPKKKSNKKKKQQAADQVEQDHNVLPHNTGQMGPQDLPFQNQSMPHQNQHFQHNIPARQHMQEFGQHMFQQFGQHPFNDHLQGQFNQNQMMQSQMMPGQGQMLPGQGHPMQGHGQMMQGQGQYQGHAPGHIDNMPGSRNMYGAVQNPVFRNQQTTPESSKFGGDVSQSEQVEAGNERKKLESSDPHDSASGNGTNKEQDALKRVQNVDMSPQTAVSFNDSSAQLPTNTGPDPSTLNDSQTNEKSIKDVGVNKNEEMKVEGFSRNNQMPQQNLPANHGGFNPQNDMFNRYPWEQSQFYDMHQQQRYFPFFPGNMPNQMGPGQLPNTHAGPVGSLETHPQPPNRPGTSDSSKRDEASKSPYFVNSNDSMDGDMNQPNKKPRLAKPIPVKATAHPNGIDFMNFNNQKEGQWGQQNAPSCVSSSSVSFGDRNEADVDGGSGKTKSQQPDDPNSAASIQDGQITAGHLHETTENNLPDSTEVQDNLPHSTTETVQDVVTESDTINSTETNQPDTSKLNTTDKEQHVNDMSDKITLDPEASSKLEGSHAKPQELDSHKKPDTAENTQAPVLGIGSDYKFGNVYPPISDPMNKDVLSGKTDKPFTKNPSDPMNSLPDLSAPFQFPVSQHGGVPPNGMGQPVSGNMPPQPFIPKGNLYPIPPSLTASRLYEPVRMASPYPYAHTGYNIYQRPPLPQSNKDM